MQILTLATVLLLILVLVLLWRRRDVDHTPQLPASSRGEADRGPHVPLSRLSSVMDELMKAYDAENFLIVSIPGTEDFIQFSADKNYVQFCSPLITPRQKQLKVALLDVYEDLGLSSYITNSGAEFLDCDVEGTAGQISKIATRVIMEVFGVDADGSVEMTAEGIDINRLI